MSLQNLLQSDPFLVLDKNDDRFVGAYGVADSIDDCTDLAAMEWPDFET